jgi:hypothetical protein
MKVGFDQVNLIFWQILKPEFFQALSYEAILVKKSVNKCLMHSSWTFQGHKHIFQGLFKDIFQGLVKDINTYFNNFSRT